jgi:putative spermidine/putrescine transport system ATP-binding protein
VVQSVSGDGRWASLRPESIRIVRTGEEAPVLMTGTVVSRSYLGATTRLAVDVDGSRIQVVAPSGEALPAEGESVNLTFARGALHMFGDGP